MRSFRLVAAFSAAMMGTSSGGAADLLTSPTDDGYVGCFADDQHDRVLGAKMVSSEMTSEVSKIPTPTRAFTPLHAEIRLEPAAPHYERS